MVKPQPDFVADEFATRSKPDDKRLDRLGQVIRCPYGQIGGRLWGEVSGAGIWADDPWAWVMEFHRLEVR